MYRKKEEHQRMDVQDAFKPSLFTLTAPNGKVVRDSNSLPLLLVSHCAAKITCSITSGELWSYQMFNSFIDLSPLSFLYDLVRQSYNWQLVALVFNIILIAMPEVSLSL